ncbi:GNAT family N-acetyltransferase [Oceanibium sediminis]|uniref:GNAT family N-acetyltransferase n=1 Tax=Oceanibium sediminis TaxID=2026339 RepID=UPI000DD2C6C3|nr:GNAT family N-acetyltransferase [Oceanibium sediminis]
MKTPLIRPLRPEDEVAWRGLWFAYLDFYGASVPEEVYATYFARLLSDDPGEYHCRLALVDDTAVGLVHYLFHRHGWKLENVVYIQDLYVTPALRGSGTGRALIETVYVEADAAGCPSVYWLTQEFNETARVLYDRVGEVTPFIKYQRPAS